MRASIFISVTAFFIVFGSHLNAPAKQYKLPYEEKFANAKESYPFNEWRQRYNHGLKQYNEINCSRMKKIFDDLISGLIAVGENATESTKIKVFKSAILETNKLNEECKGALIETQEAEELCNLTNKITIACGLNPQKYGDGEGLASEWRDW